MSEAMVTACARAGNDRRSQRLGTVSDLSIRRAPPLRGDAARRSRRNSDAARSRLLDRNVSAGRARADEGAARPDAARRVIRLGWSGRNQYPARADHLGRGYSRAGDH